MFWSELSGTGCQTRLTAFLPVGHAHHTPGCHSQTGIFYGGIAYDETKLIEDHTDL